MADGLFGILGEARSWTLSVGDIRAGKRGRQKKEKKLNAKRHYATFSFKSKEGKKQSDERW